MCVKEGNFDPSQELRKNFKWEPPVIKVRNGKIPSLKEIKLRNLPQFGEKNWGKRKPLIGENSLPKLRPRKFGKGLVNSGKNPKEGMPPLC